MVQSHSTEKHGILYRIDLQDDKDYRTSQNKTKLSAPKIIKTEKEITVNSETWEAYITE